MKKIALIVVLLAFAAGCTGPRCDKVQVYQQVEVQDPLEVPADLTQPPLRSRAPDVPAQVRTRRSDGRCLDEPPAYVPEEEGDNGSG